MMLRVSVFTVFAFVMAACTRLPWTREARENPDEGLYYRALAHLDTSETAASLDSAVYYIDRYLASSYRQDHAWEAVVLRRLALQAQELRRVQTALQRADGGRSAGRRTETAGGEVARADDSAREIQRLKEDLARANAELERIRRRLANPKEP